MTTRTRAIPFFLAAAFLVLAACGPTAPAPEQAPKKDAQTLEYEKAVTCMQYSLPDEAFKYLTNALRIDPRHVPSLNLLGLAQMMKGNLPEAVKALEACVGAKPDFSEAWNNLGTAYQESNRKDKAEEAFAKAFALDQNYNASYNLARMAYEKPDYPTALDLVRKSIEKYPRSILAFNLQGLVLENLERYDEALDSYQQALRLSPGELNVQFNIAAVYYKKKNYDLSRDLLQRILPQAKNAELRSRIEELLKRLAR